MSIVIAGDNNTNFKNLKKKKKTQGFVVSVLPFRDRRLAKRLSIFCHYINELKKCSQPLMNQLENYDECFNN